MAAFQTFEVESLSKIKDEVRHSSVCTWHGFDKDNSFSKENNYSPPEASVLLIKE